MTTKWDRLPNEILTAILTRLFDAEFPLYKLTLVSKQWLANTLPLLYKKVRLTFRNEDKLLLRTLKTSQYHVADYVKGVFMYTIVGAPTSGKDNLKKMVEYCPNVEKLGFLSMPQTEDGLVQYVYEAFTPQHTWHLRELPEKVDKQSSKYHFLADLMQESLEKLTVDGVRDEGRFDFLQNYTALTNVDMSVAKGVTDCVRLLQFTPQITRLCATFARSATATTVADMDALALVQVPKTLKKVIFHGFEPKNDRDLQLIIDKFKNVEEISLSVEMHIASITSNTISPPIMQSFIQYVTSIVPAGGFAFYLLEESDWFNAYFQSAANFPKRNHVMLNFEPFLEIGTKLSVSHNGIRLSSSVTRLPTLMQKIGGILTNFGDQIEHLHLKVPVICSLRDCLEIIFQHCPQLNELVLEGGFFAQPEYDEELTNQYQSIKKLALKEVSVKGSLALVFLSTYFERLDSIKIIDCMQCPRDGEEEEDEDFSEDCYGEEEDGFFDSDYLGDNFMMRRPFQEDSDSDDMIGGQDSDGIHWVAAPGLDMPSDEEEAIARRPFRRSRADDLPAGFEQLEEMHSDYEDDANIISNIFAQMAAEQQFNIRHNFQHNHGEDDDEDGGDSQHSIGIRVSEDDDDDDGSEKYPPHRNLAHDNQPNFAGTTGPVNFDGEDSADDTEPTPQRHFARRTGPRITEVNDDDEEEEEEDDEEDSDNDIAARIRQIRRQDTNNSFRHFDTPFPDTQNSDISEMMGFPAGTDLQGVMNLFQQSYGHEEGAPVNFNDMHNALFTNSHRFLEEQERIQSGKGKRHNNISIGMDSTHFGTFIVEHTEFFVMTDNEDTRETVIFFSIMTAGAKAMRFYVKYATKEIQEIESSNEFYALEYETKLNQKKEYKTISLTFNLKSYKEIIFKSSDVTFTFSFND